MKLHEAKACVFIDIFQFNTNRFWAFKQMILGPRAIANVRGLRFYRFLGTGGGMGFSLRPDFGTYAVLTQWDDPEDYKKFIATHSYWATYQRHATQQRTLHLIPVQSHGKWDQSNPFASGIIKDLEVGDAPVAIVTRATVNWNRLFSFWRAVPNAAKSIESATDVLYYKGIGEWPWVQQATVSIWKNFDAVNAYAYKNRDHADIVQKTRLKKWYKEDLFSRFVVKKDTHFQPIIV